MNIILAYNEGIKAFFQDKYMTDNPYDPSADQESYKEWERGFIDADLESRGFFKQ